MGSAGKYKKCKNKPIKGRKITGFSIPRSVRLPRCSGEMRRRDIRHGCAANIVTTQRGSSAPDSVPRASASRLRKSRNKPTSRQRREVILRLPKDLEWHLLLGGQKCKNKPTLSSKLLHFLRGRWRPPPPVAKRARRSSVRHGSRFAAIARTAPASFSRKQEREKRRERERKNKPTSATPRDRRKERITIDAMSAAGFFEVSPSCADAASRATASSRRPRQGCGLA